MDKHGHVQIYPRLHVYVFGGLVNVTIGMNESMQVYRLPWEMSIDKEGDKKIYEKQT